MIETAENIFHILGKAVCPLETVIFFDIVLPILDEISSTDSELERWNETRHLLYGILRRRCEHEWENAAPGLHTYDVLFPTLLSGMREKNQTLQTEAVGAMTPLILIAGEFSNIL